MRKFIRIWALLLPILAALGACSGSSSQPVPDGPGRSARFVYVVDVSVSPATMNDATVTRAVEHRIGDDMRRDARLGDSITVFEAGASDAARMVSHPAIVTGYNLRLPAAHARLMTQMDEIAARFRDHGGDDSTHLVESLEAIHPDCSSGRDVITLVTDGVEDSGSYSASKALAAGKPVTLPSPPGRYLEGCHKVILLGFGLTIDPSSERPQLLPAKSLAALRQGWLNYLTEAGMHAEDVEFVSAF